MFFENRIEFKNESAKNKGQIIMAKLLRANGGCLGVRKR
jgi:hypothetical protein